MPLAANTTGEHSTLAVLAGLAILVWSLGVIIALTGWVAQATRSRIRKRRVRTHAANGAAPAPGSRSAPSRPPSPTSPRATRQQNANSAASAATITSSSRQLAAAVKPAANPAPPAIPGARLSPETLEPLAQCLDAARLREIAEARVAKTLTALPRDRWNVERYVVIEGHRIPFVILGETGVFAVWALGWPPMWHELAFFSQTGAHVEKRLPGYTASVRTGVCRTLADHEIKPRWWCRSGEPGAWVMGVEWLIRWIEHFGPEHGIGVKDIERLRQLANPRRDSPSPRVPEAVPDDGWVTPPAGSG